MKKLLIQIPLYLLIGGSCLAQKQSFDVVSFTAPKNWQKIQNDGGIQLSVSDTKTGGYALALITKTTTTAATANENFNTNWINLVQSTVKVTTKPIMVDPSTQNGWEIISGSANYTDGGNKGSATLLTATGGGQTASVILMSNTNQYKDELLSFINSLELTPVSSNTTHSTVLSTPKNGNNPSVTGIWIVNQSETRGFVNGFLMYTGGYMRKEYQFKDDGTYIFREKNWLVNTDAIYFAYESGTWALKGNQLTITPKKGKAGWWNKDKQTNDVNKWGSFQKAAEYKIQPVTYKFEIKEDPNYSNAIVLNTDKPTQRDGGQFNDPPYRFPYIYKDASLIDNPPGFKSDLENQPLSSSPTSAEKNSGKVTPPSGVENTDPITGLWTYYTLETTGNYINNMPQYTSGYSRKEYSFNADGTYLFRNKQWLTKAPDITFMYETGTYTVRGNQLILTPKSGKAGFWGKKSSTKEWGSLKKSSDYKLEKTTYTFEMIKDPTYGNSIILKTVKPTQRDGGQFNSKNEPYEFKYSFRTSASLVDNPPGFKMDL